MRPVAVYSALRLGLFLATLLLLRALNVGGALSVVIALVVAMLLSFIVLRRQRDAVTRALMERKAAARVAPEAPRRSRWSFGGRLAEDAAAEDRAVDDATASSADHRGDRPAPRTNDGPAGGPR